MLKGNERAGPLLRASRLGAGRAGADDGHGGGVVRGGPVPARRVLIEPGDFEELYDEPTLGTARTSRAHLSRRTEVVRGWRSGLGAGAIAATAMIGVRDVLEPERRDPIIEEVDLSRFVDVDAPVVYHHVPGHPKASRAIVRPWLF